MVNIEFVFDRLKQFLKVTSDIDLADKLNISNVNLSGYRRRKTIPYEHIFIALKNTDADLQWIFYGVESKMVQPKTAYIQYYSDITSSDGNGNINCAGPYDMIQIDAGMYPYADIKNSMAIQINSSSMYSTLNSQDIVMIDKSKSDIVHGKAYLIEIEKDVSIMRIYKSPGGYIVASDNKNYPRYELKEGEFRVIGRMLYKQEYVG